MKFPRRHLRLRHGILVLAVGLVGLGLTVAVLRGPGEGSPTARSHRAQPKTYAQLVAENYKVLRPEQSRRLLRFARAWHACVAAHVRLGEPKAMPTRITMALPGSGTLPSPAVLRLGARCGERLGDPPSGSSLQFRPHVVVLYLPKRCLLDRQSLRDGATRSLPAGGRASPARA
jgi:hypothetical protein